VNGPYMLACPRCGTMHPPECGCAYKSAVVRAVEQVMADLDTLLALSEQEGDTEIEELAVEAKLFALKAKVVLIRRRRASQPSSSSSDSSSSPSSGSSSPSSSSS
jgi:hypothetical protein